MKKITKVHKPKENKYIFTEGINYFETGKTSIWGTGDKDTLELLRKIKIHGKCLNLAAGDGRYNLNLLKKTNFVLASDIDEGALSKLLHNTPKKYKKKLDTKAFDITKKFHLKVVNLIAFFARAPYIFFQKKFYNK